MGVEKTLVLIKLIELFKGWQEMFSCPLFVNFGMMCELS